MKLKDLGFDPWFEAQAAEYLQEGCVFARIAAVDRGSYLIRNELAEIPAELSGRLSFQVESPAELPCVGDWVTAQVYNDGTAAIIHRVFPRRTFLRRSSPGESTAVQMIAANLDIAYIVQSCHFDFNPRRLDRYLVMAADGGVAPIVILTKTDLVSPDELGRKMAIIRSATQAQVLALSNVTGAGLDEFRQTLAPGKTCCLLGSSGVGKTSLINGLLGREAYDTRAVSATGEGTHTTTRRELIVLGDGAMLIDTPGMRELGVLGGDGVGAGFAELAGLAARCRYADCSHHHEPGCAVRAALERGELSPERYASYLKLQKEAAHHEMSDLERRRKDKAFGRFIKSVKKRLKD